MDYAKLLKKYRHEAAPDRIGKTLAEIERRAAANMNAEVYKKCFGCLDLTSLGNADSHDSIESMTLKAVDLKKHFPDVPDVASICVFPPFVETVGLVIGNSDISITSVAGGFPASQTFIEVKMLEAAMAVENGADEIDIVMNSGDFLSGEYDIVFSEIAFLKDEAGEGTVLKVILETGLLQEPQAIFNASMLAMCAGADFIKTSTGKYPVQATPEAAAAMCTAIRKYYEETDLKAGFKAAGGISTAADAVRYYTIAEHILGTEWLTPALFRIGASSLADNLLSAIGGKEISYF